MLKSVPYIAAVAFLTGLSPLPVSPVLPALPPAARADTPVSAAVAAAVADLRRPADQVKLDAARKPAQLLAFAELKAGDRVADFMPGNGYFTRIISDVVGTKGHVYAFLPKEQLANCAPSKVAGSKALERDPGYVNVSVLSAATANFNLTSLDVIWTAQNYHDLHDFFIGTGECSRATESLHRIDPMRLRTEIEGAGFVLDAQSDLLRNPEDDHTLSVFDGRVRSHTDQVVFRFRKPK